MKWPDGTTEPKEIGFCPNCGEQEPDDTGGGSFLDPDHPRNEIGNLICAECHCERDEEVEYVPVKVVPLEDTL